LLAAAPYVRMVIRRARPFGPQWPSVAAADLTADAAGLVSLVRGMLRYRSLLL
jgi:hypothetical protein